ncbi:RDD family protein [Nocardia blacklockiae]|uniref:RDD family protein n=1 Tax=Nocardia blacklockiae TaxID=480036 RepID=UPI001894A67C|nr:RDD family protein [Nocardia blacklockiae]MBF6174739.1 RDD family protein [Nocardia blacklockiae]
MNAPHRTPAPSPATGAPGPRVADEAGENRLALAAITDALLALVGGFALSQRVFHATDGVVAFWGTFLACALAVSFVNQVGGTVLFRGSVAKYLFGMRVIRWKDGRRPGFWRAFARWLFGFVIVGLQFALEGASVGQACGLRTVRRRDLNPASPPDRKR